MSCTGGGAGGGSNTSTVTQVSQPPPDFLAAYRALQSRATGVANQPLQQFSGPMVAGFTPAQLSAFDTVNNAQGVGVPFTNAAATMAGNAAQPVADQIPLLSDSTNAGLAGSAAKTFTSGAPNYWRSAMASLPMLLAATGLGGSPAMAGQGGTGVGGAPPGISGTMNPGVGGGPTANAGLIKSFENPYTDDVVNSTLANVDRSNAIQQNDLTGNAIASGAWGGDRAGVAKAELDRTQGLARAQTEAQLRASGYSQAVGAAQNMTAQELQGLGLATNANQGQDQSNIARATGAMGAYGQQLSAAEQAAIASGQLGLGAGQLMSGLGGQAQNQALTGASAQLSTGALQQQLAQEQLNIPYQQFQAAQNYPFYTTNFLGQMTGMAGAGAGDTTSKTSPGPSAASQGLGALGSLTGILGQTGAFGNSGWLGSLLGLGGAGGGLAAGSAAAGMAGMDMAGAATQIGASLLPFLIMERGGRVGGDRAHGGVVGGDADGAGGAVGDDSGVGGDLSILRRPQGAADRAPIVVPQLPLRGPSALPVTSGTPGASLSINPVSNWSPPAPAMPAVMPQDAGVGGTPGYNPADPSTWNFSGAPAAGQAGVGGVGGSLTPGMMAAQQATGTRGGGGNAGINGLGAIDPLNLFGGRKNNSPIQDISQALALGRTITDAQWAQAGFGPGGAALTAGGAQSGVGGATPFLSHSPFSGQRAGYADGGVGGDDDDSAPFSAPDLPEVATIAPYDISLNSPVSRTRRGPPAPPHAAAAPNAGLGAPVMAAAGSAAGVGAAPDGATSSGLTDSAWMPLIQAGLATMAGSSPYALTNLGQGGLYGIKAAEEQKSATEAKAEKQQEISLKQSEAEARARQIDAEITHYMNEDKNASDGTWSHTNQVDEDGNYVEVNSKTGETRKGSKAGALPESQGTKDERDIQRKRGESEDKYRTRMLELREQEIAQGKYTWQPGMGPDANDPTKQVAGSWRFPTKSDEDPKFIPGAVMIGKPGSGSGKDTALTKNAQFLVDNGIATDLQSAVKMLRTGVNDGAVFQRLVQAEKKILISNNYGMADADAEKQAVANVKARVGSTADEPPAAPKGSPAAIPPRPAALPPGTQWSPSRQQWRDPSNKLYDASGNPV